MSKALTFLLCFALLALTSCGDGQWGAELRLSLLGLGEASEALSPGDPLTLPGGGYQITVDRACLAVETAVITPEGSGGTVEGGEDCFCHGDPPHCHGDCGDTGESAAQRPVVAPLHRVVDLLAGPTLLLTQGAAPADYLKVAFAFSKADAPGDPPPACGDMDGRTFLLEGTLTDLQSGDDWPLVVDIRANDKVTDAVTADPPATATDEDPATLEVGLRLDLALGHVDFAAVTRDATGLITIGGALSQHIVAVGEVVEGLIDGESLTARAVTRE